MRSTATEIRRSETPEKILNLVDSLCRRFGGVSQVIREYVGLLESSETPPASKVKMHSTILWMAIVAERTQLAQEQESTPEKFVRTLHQCGQLAPILQAMYQAAEIGFDDLDPPPKAC